MRRLLAAPLAALAAGACAWAGAAPRPAPPPAARQTVCTITVNSADEKQAFRRHLPASAYDFVELVERGRPDWLASACSAQIRCDVLLISGHYDGGNEFFSDQLDHQEFLPVDELERVSCSASCPSLFAQLKEVHLYGCNTLDPTPLSSATAEIVRSLVREGQSLRLAEQQLRALNAQHGQSSRDRMRLVFKDVPVIYGFSSVAPLGPSAAATLERFFRSAGSREIGRGRASPRLLGHFAPLAMTVAAGINGQDPLAAMRHEVCQFVDDRLPEAQRVGFIHRLLQHDMATARIHLDRIQRDAARRAASRTPPAPDVAQAMAGLVADDQARRRFLALARDADQPAVGARMFTVARDLGWLSAAERRDELAQMLSQVLVRGPLGQTEVNLACALNQDGELDGLLDATSAGRGPVDSVPQAAVRACLGDASARWRTLQGLVGTSLADAQAARAYLRQRPLTDGAELQRLVAVAITRMPASDAQVRALETFGRRTIADREILELLIQLYAGTPSWAVQAAVAGVLIRADLRALDAAPLERTLRARRRPAPAGDNLIDVLIRTLRVP